MVDNAHAALPQLNAALRHGQRISVDLQAMQAIADRVGAGEETYYVPCLGPLHRLHRWPKPRANEISRILDAEIAASALADTAEEAETTGTPANIDSVLREILEAGWKSTRPPCRTGCVRRSRHRSRSATHSCAQCTP